MEQSNPFLEQEKSVFVTLKPIFNYFLPKLVFFFAIFWQHLRFLANFCLFRDLLTAFSCSLSALLWQNSLFFHNFSTEFVCFRDLFTGFVVFNDILRKFAVFSQSLDQVLFENEKNQVFFSGVLTDVTCFSRSIYKNLRVFRDIWVKFACFDEIYVFVRFLMKFACFSWSFGKICEVYAIF